jgi:DNA-binding MarR family transcriptional regulator
VSETEWLNDAEQETWRRYRWMHRELTRRLNRQLIQEAGVSEPEYTILASLSEAPNQKLRVYELRNRLDWEKTRLTHQLTRMTERGLVKRLPSPGEPRGANIALTRAGRELIEAAAPAHVAQVRRLFFDALTPAQLKALDSIADNILTRLDDEPGD